MKILIGHPDSLIRTVFTAYCKRLSYLDCHGVRYETDVLQEIVKTPYDVVALPFEWLSPTTPAVSLFQELQDLHNVRTIIMTTDFSKKEEKWCEDHHLGVYVQLPISFGLFKMLISPDPLLKQ